jgi:hypothetical protein
MADVLYTAGKTSIIDRTIDWVNDTIKVILVGTATPYTPSAAHVYVTASGVGTSELTGVSGYTRGYAGAGRKSLASKTISISGTDCKLDAADLVAGSTGWTALGAGDTIAGAVLVKEVTSDALSLLICYFDLTDTPCNGSDIWLTFSGSGLLTF